MSFVHALHRCRRGLLACAAVTALGCGDPSASLISPDSDLEGTLRGPRLSLTTPTNGNIAVDDGVVIELQNDGELKVTNTATGNTIYAELDPAQMEVIAAMFDALRGGDANYLALGNLNPYENAPPGYEPMSQPFGGVELLSIPELGPRTAPSFPYHPPMLRPIQSGSATPSFLETSLLTTEWDGPKCMAMANAISANRWHYLNTRSSPLQALRGIASLFGANIGWKNGKPYAALNSLEDIIASVGVFGANLAAQSTQLIVLRGLYNAQGCQAPIMLNVSPPTSIFPGNGSGWSDNNTCHTVVEQWEISFDGGATWHPFDVVVVRCSTSAQ